ncbi:MAG: hypothetical protein WA666_12950 [Nitrospirota bacterium]
MNEDLDNARKLADLIVASLPKRIEIAALSLNSKLPFKALGLRELLIHRMADLATAAVDLFYQKKAIPAVIITRAAIETLSILYALHEQTNEFLSEKNIPKFDDFLMKSSMGSRKNPDLPAPTNILTFIKKIEKDYPDFGFEFYYETLCEYTHPNWAGTFGSYGLLDRDALVLQLGPTERANASNIGILALCSTLEAFRFFYNSLSDPLLQLNDYFEKQVPDSEDLTF